MLLSKKVLKGWQGEVWVNFNLQLRVLNRWVRTENWGCKVSEFKFGLHHILAV